MALTAVLQPKRFIVGRVTNGLEYLAHDLNTRGLRGVGVSSLCTIDGCLQLWLLLQSSCPRA